ncbi:hypothetical protein [Parasitella parasitica]|uniref:Uncharacterized protein n=1 Tax=Parasitella parasitica TaxID=35722 RepID=A0A0B7N4W9_9FUNG|nr:hypothetical protein [Parasitella parasitica]
MNSTLSNHQINNHIFTKTSAIAAVTLDNTSTILKRKRTMKSVQFVEKVTVLETYSSDEYDRSDMFSAPVFYKLNPTILPPQLSLNIDNVPNLVRDSVDEGCISSAENSPNTPPFTATSKNIADHYFQQENKKKKRPILSINTTICADPLFFTGLSTNYKNEKSTANDDFLVPVSAVDMCN